MRPRFQLYKKALQYKFEQMSKRRAFFFQTPRHGIEDILDIAPWIKEDDTIIDVGANDGESAIRFRAMFPHNPIVCFEPIAETFAKLVDNTKNLGVATLRLALGPEEKTQMMFLTELSVTNSLVKPSDEEIRGTQQVDVIPLDKFARGVQVGNIGLLKIDAEGYDLEVIKGATATLSSGRVKFVMAEVGFHPGDNRHPLFDDVRSALMACGLRVFGLYAQRLELTGEPSLRLANAIFCKEGLSR